MTAKTLIGPLPNGMPKPPRQFTTDYCSGGMSWTWRKLFGYGPPWEGACLDHDTIYWGGGSATLRRLADADLMSSVAARGHPLWAILIWVSVRIGGHPYLPFPWRWGYGWPYPDGYKDRITQEYKNKLKRMLE